ncbi:MAG: hypothetical protein A4E53_03704 [Pelotomaculum sp. PtaB.Bin104]|nr:MAG: hypothetical protein A4E53_03704 [Pelotomaculum sp. PtaB.Bin104]
MSKNQINNEIKYKIALSLMESLLSRGIITLEEYQEADKANQHLYMPQLAEVYM